jgi:hypothetical protein
MKVCPRCHQRGISIKDLANSNPASPCRCAVCNTMFFMPGVFRNLLDFVPHFLLPFVFIAALILESWWPIIAFVITVPLTYLGLAFICKPTLTTKEIVRESKRYETILRYIVLLVVLGAILWWFL